MAAPMIPAFFPRDKYYCVLDEQPDFLAPVVSDGHVTEGELVVNPRCWLGWHAPLPPALAAMAVWHENLYDCPWTIWIDDTDRGALWPYWLGPRYAHLLAGMVPGAPLSVYPDVAARLRTTGIGMGEGDAERWHAERAAAVDGYAWWFSRGYVALPGLLPPYHVASLRRYYRYHTRMGRFTLGDEQAPGRYVAYDEPVTRYVHQQLVRTVSDIARRPVVPTYNYLALYQPGPWLDPHTDRDVCQYTISLCIDATPDPSVHGDWPLYLMTEDGPYGFTLGIGDALLFRGRELSPLARPAPRRPDRLLGPVPLHRRLTGSTGRAGSRPGSRSSGPARADRARLAPCPSRRRPPARLPPPLARPRPPPQNRRTRHSVAPPGPPGPPLPRAPRIGKLGMSVGLSRPGCP
jgi:hypothetical protein